MWHATSISFNSEMDAIAPHGEMNRCLLGDGCVPLPELLELLHENGYRGPWEVELIGEDVEAIGYEQLLDHTKRYLDQTLAQLC